MVYDMALNDRRSTAKFMPATSSFSVISIEENCITSAEAKLTIINTDWEKFLGRIVTVNEIGPSLDHFDAEPKV